MPLIDTTRRGPLLGAPWRRGRDSDASGDCFVSHTVFRYDRWRDLPQIGIAAERAARLFAAHDGSVALLQWFLPGGRLIGDLSIWRNEEQLRAFLVTPEHVELVTRWREYMHGTHHSWTAPADRAAVWRRAKPLIA